MRERSNVEGVSRGTLGARLSSNHSRMTAPAGACNSWPVRVTGSDVEGDGIALDVVLATYCSTCETWREVRDWHESGDALLIELETCGHVARRTARLEWLPSATVHTPAASGVFSGDYASVL